ncbi:MAG: iron ABC transporter permease [Clostridia bacterium]|nr:iron ABC transporter permease [Clostridia bacterium]
MQRMGMPVHVGISILLLLMVLLSIVIAVTIGSTYIDADVVYEVIMAEILHKTTEISTAIHDVVWHIRLPRLVLAVVVGGGLSVCGIVMQAVVQNPLADPYILGVSSGASFGATLAILLGVGLAFGSGYVGVIAFGGAFIASLLVMVIANVGGRANSVKLLLSGTAINAVFSAFSSFLVFFANDREGIKNITFWLMGSLAGAKWSDIVVIYVVVLSGVFFFLSQYRTLNMMLVGDETSITLGTDLHKYRHIYMMVVALMIGFIVYASGMIGFIGLIIPHFMRILFGTDHKKLILVSFLIGGLFLIWADVLSRIIIPHTELPIGILISMVGAPCFIYLLVRKSYGFGGRN